MVSLLLAFASCNDSSDVGADVDECSIDIHNCDTNATCANSDGSFTCSCNKGYSGNGVTCTDTDECGGVDCGFGGTCANVGDGYACSCATGYTNSDAGDPASQCTDTDECGGVDCGFGSTCTNVGDGYACSCGYGSILGRVCAPSGSEWLAGVIVSVSSIDCDGNPIVVQDFTDANGSFQLGPIPNGLHQLLLETGSYITIISDLPVNIGEVTNLSDSPGATCLDPDAASIAVLGGTFDHVQQILDQLGIAYELYDGDTAVTNPGSPANGLDLLMSLGELLGYDILFINSGMWFDTFLLMSASEIQLMVQNLVTFVESGGSLYVSDLAYFWAELAFPEMIDYYGDDMIDGEAQVGAIDDNVVADVLSQSFQQALGLNTTTVSLNRPAWVVASSVSFATTVHILAPTATLMSGSVSSDVPLIVSHRPSPTSGTIFFTSFHHEATMSQDMEQVLHFLVFQL